MLELNLQMFAEGGAPAGAPTGGEGQPAQSPGDMQAAAGLEKLRAKRPQPQHVEFELPTQQQPAQSPPAEQPKPTFEDLIKGEYKEDFGKEVSRIVQERLKNSKQAEAKLEKLSPALEALVKKYGLEEGDLDGLVKKITDDDALYEDEALERGIPVETLKQMKQLEQQKNYLERMQAQRMQEEAMQKHFQHLATQAEELRKVYPGFDLQAELGNEQFARLTHPSVNVPLRTIYEIVHKDEILGGAMQYTAQKVSEGLSNSMRATANRPAENGLNATSNAVKLSENAHTWPPEVLKQMREDIKRGKKFVM